MSTDLKLFDSAMELVKRMNPQEASRFPQPFDDWPQWAKNDTQLAYMALMEARPFPRLHIERKDTKYLPEFWLHVQGDEGRKASINITPSKKSVLVRRTLLDATNNPAPVAYVTTSKEQAQRIGKQDLDLRFGTIRRPHESLFATNTIQTFAAIRKLMHSTGAFVYGSKCVYRVVYLNESFVSAKQVYPKPAGPVISKFHLRDLTFCQQREAWLTAARNHCNHPRYEDISSPPTKHAILQGNEQVFHNGRWKDVFTMPNFDACRKYKWRRARF